MTVGVVVRVPGQGAVLVSDGRYTYGDEVCSDSHKKWFELGSAVGVWAGSAGGMWADLENKPPRNWAELRERLAAPARGREYDVMVYDRAKDRVIHTDHEGDVVLPGNYGAVGSGGPFALGVLDAAKPPATLEAALKLAQRAVKIACKRNVFCGGRIRSVIVRGRRGSAEVR